MAEVVMELRDVVKDYQISRGLFRKKEVLRAVDNVSLTIHRGEVIGLVGESGCGKTTLAKILLGLIPPTSGTVRLCKRLPGIGSAGP